MIRKTDLNMVPLNAPAGAGAQCAHRGNVDSVFAAGDPVKRDGRMIHTDNRKLRQLADEARNHIFSSCGNPDNAWLI
ncbi:MAG: hypothetical protein EA344_01640 [Alkalicoccus sp.]|nr:MAG: hypothetical protein EA344_01640 [Alkalicoccus sp.]